MTRCLSRCDAQWLCPRGPLCVSRRLLGGETGVLAGLGAAKTGRALLSRSCHPDHLINILGTRRRPDARRANVAGVDVVAHRREPDSPSAPSSRIQASMTTQRVAKPRFSRPGLRHGAGRRRARSAALLALEQACWRAHAVNPGGQACGEWRDDATEHNNQARDQSYLSISMQ